MKKLRVITAMIAMLGVLPLASYSAANAHSISSRDRYWQPPAINLDLSTGQIVTPFCDGKYEAVAKELNRENVLGQVNLYRLQTRLPPLRLQTYQRGYTGYGAHTRRHTRFRDSRLLLEHAQSHLSAAAQEDYLRTLDLTMRSGPTFDWWLRPDEFEHVQYGCSVHRHDRRSQRVGRLCEAQRGAAKAAATSTAFDWLITGHALQRAETAWIGSAYTDAKQIGNIFDHIDRQALARPGVNMWMAQYMHHVLFKRDVPAEISRRANDAVASIMSCQSSPAEYGIIAQGDLGLPHDYLPKVLAERRTQRDIHTLTYDAVTQGNGLDEIYHAQLRSMTARLENKLWATGFLFLSAPDAKAAIAVHDEAAQTEEANANLRLLHRGRASVAPLFFSFPTQDIPEKYSGMRLAHALSEGETEFQNGVANDAHFLALEALEKDIKHRQDRIKLVEDYRARRKGPLNSYQQYRSDQELDGLRTQLERLEKRHAAFISRDIQKSNLPDRVKLTLIALRSNASHNLVSHHRDIFIEQSGADFLDIFLRRQLFPATRHRHYFTYSIPRAYLDGEYSVGKAFDLPSLKRSDGAPNVGMAAFVDWDKLALIGDEKRLTRTMAINIFDWLDQASPQDRAAHADLIAPALYDIIRICRHEDAGIYNGAPLQQRAFERLHKYYGNTASAQKTPHWWASKRRHGNKAL